MAQSFFRNNRKRRKVLKLSRVHHDLYIAAVELVWTRVLSERRCKEEIDSHERVCTFYAAAIFSSKLEHPLVLLVGYRRLLHSSSMAKGCSFLTISQAS